MAAVSAAAPHAIPPAIVLLDSLLAPLAAPRSLYLQSGKGTMFAITTVRLALNTRGKERL